MKPSLIRFRLLPAAALWTATCLAQPAHAGTDIAPPDAGQTLHRLEAAKVPPAPRPAAPKIDVETPAATPAPADTATVQLSGIELVHGENFPPDELAGLVAAASAGPLDFAGLEALAARVGAWYQQHGYPAAYAYLPPQELAHGRLQIAVLEGRYGEIEIRNAGVLRPGVIPLGELKAGDTIHQAPLERSIALLSEIAGVQVNAGLKPGARSGDSDLLVELLPGRAWTGQLQGDNSGDPSTGKIHLGGNLSFNNLAGFGDQLNLRLLSGGKGLNYGSLGWQTLIGPYGTHTGFAATRMHYRLGDAFAGLQGNGDSSGLGWTLSHPLLRSASLNLNLNAGLDHKHIEDRFDAAGTSNEKSARVANFGISGQLSDDLAGGGMNSFSLAVTHGRLAIQSADTAQTDAVSAMTAGLYSKLNLSLQRLQTLSASTSLLLSGSLQLASKNLDSSEKFTLGGPGAVRAYAAGDVSLDDARLFTVELRQAMSEQWQAATFIDAGQGRVNHQLWSADAQGNQRNLRGAGLALNWSTPGGLSASLTVARRLGEANVALPATRVWLQMAMSF